MRRLHALAAVLFAISLNACANESAEVTDKGQQVYNQACVACHLSGVAGAPKLGDAAAWTERANLGMEALLASVKNGKGAMPPMGACGYCTDEDFTAAINYMIDNSK